MITDNRIALLLIAMLTGALIFVAVPADNRPLVTVVIGGLIGVLKNASDRKPPQP